MPIRTAFDSKDFATPITLGLPASRTIVCMTPD